VRVLFVAHSYPRRPGDVPGAFLHRLAVALAPEGVEVRVLAPAGDGAPAEERMDGVPVRRYRYAPRGAERLAYGGTMMEQVRDSWGGRVALVGMLGAAAAAVRAAVRSGTVDLVHAHWWFPGALAAAPAVGRAPLVLTMHGSDVRLARGAAPARRLFRAVAGRAAAVTAVSRWLCDEAAAMAPGLACGVAPMPVAADRFTPPAADAPREGVLFVGRLTAQKGVDTLLRAAALARPAPVTIVGAGPEAPRLRALALELGIADRVRWVEAQPQAELATFYRAAAVVAVPSHQEGLGLVAVEAGLCATPVVGFRSGGLPDVVQDGATGFLVPPGDVAEFARALDTVLGDPVLGRALGARAQTSADRFTPAVVASGYAALYRQVLAPRRARGVAS
jgi:glycosyltransferase involved in cell wall biosynthesis